MANDISGFGAIAQQQESAKQRNAATGLAENFDNFLTILTTQLQNQDPLSPMDTHEYTNQLVMFADVEQSVRQSGQLEDLINLNKSNEAIGAVSYMGKQIEADHNEVNLQDGSAAFSYSLPEEAATAALQIFNSAGELVALKQVPGDLGKHTVSWDGKTNGGAQLPDGVYSFQVGAVNGDEQAITPTYATRGKVTGVEYGADGAVLQMGGVAIPMDKVLSVAEPA